ncbi:MAG: hypothetical protein JXR95_00165 [Deltaproteobacteria bacterium]|nr:hypothetical protein [Deltaproteobacteria bacterium]
MTILIESLLRTTPFSETDKQTILKGIVQLSEADGIIDPREREYLKKFVSEFMPDVDPLAPELSGVKVTPQEVAELSSDEVVKCFAGFLTITAYSDEDFADSERKMISGLLGSRLSPEALSEIQRAVRQFLYRRVVFAFAFKNHYLHPDFAREMARRFDISDDDAIAINQGVFSALMAIKAPMQEVSDG